VLRNTTDEWDGLLMNEYAIVFDMFEWLWTGYVVILRYFMSMIHCWLLNV
jgi:RNA polymerase subunit RPABC4/transcription elongation factor Spt4